MNELSPYDALLKCPHCGQAVGLRLIAPELNERKPRPWSETTGALPNPRQKCMSCLYFVEGSGKCDRMPSPHYEKQVDKWGDSCEYYEFGRRKDDKP